MNADIRTILGQLEQLIEDHENELAEKHIMALQLMIRELSDLIIEDERN